MKKPQLGMTALAVAAAVVLGVATSDAHALALGRLTVQSALGEPLRADIDIPEINAEEAASLRVAPATPEAFRAAGLEFSPTIANLQVTLQRRTDGRYFLRLTSDRPVNDPFVDLILETSWSSGRIVRDYTLLFDPPNLRQPAQPPVAAQVSPFPVPGAAPRPYAAAAPVARAPAAPRPAPATPAPRAAPATAAAGDGQRVTVQAGDTAGKIAATHKPATVSLDQMLLALLRSNPDAFIGGNVNRLKAGAVLDLPTADQAGATGANEASQTIVAQSRDFNEFRRRLAEGLPTAKVDSSSRQASGKVQTQVEDRKSAAATPDKLTLSKGATQAQATDKIAQDRAAQESAARVAELNKNIADLNKLGTATSTTSALPAASAAKPALAVPVAAAPASAAPAAPVVAAPASAPAAAVPVAPAAVVAASAPAALAPASATAEPASAPVAAAVTASAPAPAAAASAARKLPPPAPVAEPSLVDDLLENPIVPAAAGGLLALLLGFGFYRARQRKKSNQVDSSFLESRLQPDSFFGASGGQRIDTAEGASVTGSSMVYSPSQLDAAGDVDPVAEADVYLAYGRDLQAEEILKEALRTSPQRVAIHGKLLEIYSKRRDAKAFEQVATEAYSLTRGEGPEWEHICEMGQELDSTNPLYRPGGQPSEGGPTAAEAAAAVAAASMATQRIEVVAPAPSAADLDLDLDFSLGDDEPVQPPTMPAGFSSAPAPLPEPTVSFNASPAPQAPSMDMDFDSATVNLDAPGLTLSEDSLNFDTLHTPSLPNIGAAVSTPAPTAAPAAAADSGMIEFDMGALSLDLDAPAPAPAAALGGDTEGSQLTTAGAALEPAGADDTSGDPLATKLALAEEFNAIGDPDGARSLAEEVLAEASGELKSRAQRFLAEIG